MFFLGMYSIAKLPKVKISHGSNLEQKTKWGQVYKETGIILLIDQVAAVIFVK